MLQKHSKSLGFKISASESRSWIFTLASKVSLLSSSSNSACNSLKWNWASVASSSTLLYTHEYFSWRLQPRITVCQTHEKVLFYNITSTVQDIWRLSPIFKRISLTFLQKWDIQGDIQTLWPQVFVFKLHFALASQSQFCRMRAAFRDFRQLMSAKLHYVNWQKKKKVLGFSKEPYSCFSTKMNDVHRTQENFSGCY